MTFVFGHGYGSLALPDELFSNLSPSRRQFVLRVADAVMTNENYGERVLEVLITWKISVCIIDDCIVVDNFTEYCDVKNSVSKVVCYIQNYHDEVAHYPD